jgi:hypothetical protein
MRANWFCGAIFLTLARPAAADTVTAIHPGVMCISSEALAKLTLPDGSSRTATAAPRPADLVIKQAGGCIDIRIGAHVTVITVRKNTSIVTFDPGDGQGSRTFIAPSIDFATSAQTDHAAPKSHAPAWPDADYPPLIGAKELLGALQAKCPQQGWNEHVLSHTETGPWDAVNARLTRTQHEAISREVDKQCIMGLSCPADITLGMEVQMGHLHDLVDAICTQKAPPDWSP